MHQAARDPLEQGVEGAEPSTPLIALAQNQGNVYRSAALDRVLRALNHPVRRRILRELGRRPASATALAKAFGEETGLVSYHLQQVLARECDVVELVDTVARRGALEKIYALNGEIWDVLRGSSELAEGGCEIHPVEVDGSALEAIDEARRDFRDRVSVAVEASRMRGSGSDRPTHRFILGVATFAAGEGA